jgi:hypothetical protein
MTSTRHPENEGDATPTMVAWWSQVRLEVKIVFAPLCCLV